MSYLLPWLPMLAVLVVLSAFCSATEAAFFSLTPEQLQVMRKGSASRRLVCSLLKNPDRVLSVLLFSNLIANMLFFGIISVVSLQIQKENTALAGTVSVTTFLGMLVCCEMLPKAIAVILPETISRLSAFPLLGLQWLCTPILPLLNFCKFVSLRLFAPNLHPEPLLDLNDLERAVDVSNGKKSSSPRDKKLLQALLSLSELRAEEIMRPRRLLPVFTAPVTLQNLREADCTLGWIFVQEDERQDEIARLMDFKKLVNIPTRDFTHIERFTEPAIYVPWNLPVSGVLETLLSQKCDAAVVVDEYGATPGVILLDDVLEMIYVPNSERVFQLTDRRPISQMGPYEWNVSSLFSMRHFCRYFELNSPVDCDVATVGGLISEQLQKILETGDKLNWNGLHFRVGNQTEDGGFQINVTLQPSIAGSNEARSAELRD